MNELILPLSWTQLDSMIEFMERCLQRQAVPTILRLRTQLVLEEFFSAAMAAPGADTAVMRCSLPAPRTVLLQCRSAQPDFSANLEDLQALDGEACTYGLKLALSENCCQIAVGQK